MKCLVCIQEQRKAVNLMVYHLAFKNLLETLEGSMPYDSEDFFNTTRVVTILSLCENFLVKVNLLIRADCELLLCPKR